MSMNTRIVALHDSTPFSLFYGRHFAGLHNFSATESHLLSTDELLLRLEYLTEVVFPAANECSKAARAKMIQRFNNTVLHNQFPKGSVVMTLDPISGSKLLPKYEGPYLVVDRNRGGAYILQDATGEKLKRRYAPSQMKLVLNDELDANAFTVDHIISHSPISDSQSEVLYQVRWKGFDASHDTWEPYSSFIETQCIRDYWHSINAPDPHNRSSASVTSSDAAVTLHPYPMLPSRSAGEDGTSTTINNESATNKRKRASQANNKTVTFHERTTRARMRT
ncbi:hypothetical protein BGZ76_001200 [Entomortierella beljakovae]|nr:hypothetical protein BGZ76_001200 [Entomortierella beljakovae]